MIPTVKRLMNRVQIYYKESGKILLSFKESIKIYLITSAFFCIITLWKS